MMGAGAATQETRPPTPPDMDTDQDDDAKRQRTGTMSQPLDCYPYAFSPLLLFAPSSYFDKGYSNYCAVAKFFESAVEVDMLTNVIYDRKNMLYEDLLDYVTRNRCLVTCCIDAHFTAFQVIANDSLLYYDPANPRLSHVQGDGFKRLALYLLMKCGYGDSQHVQDDPEDYYTGAGATNLRRLIYRTYRDLNKIQGVGRVPHLTARDVPLDLHEWVFVNKQDYPAAMSTQLTGNTCYFQTYLFAVLCKAGGPLSWDKQRGAVAVPQAARLKKSAISLCSFLLKFWHEDGTLRPLTNSNVVLDFHRYEAAAYYQTCCRFLVATVGRAPDYEAQFAALLAYLRTPGALHQYTVFKVEGPMPSSPNSKQLQGVHAADEVIPRLAASHYYKYRATNLMFGFNAAALLRLRSFPAFNALRKNQLLSCYGELENLIRGALPIAAAAARDAYRDYYFMPQFEVGQPELVAVHHWAYAQDMFALLHRGGAPGELGARVHGANACLAERVLFSTSRQADYEKILAPREVQRKPQMYGALLDGFMSFEFHAEYVALGFPDENPAIKDVNSLSRTVFYHNKLLSRQAHRMEYEFEKECINNMARTALRKYLRVVDSGCVLGRPYTAHLKIGQGYAFSKYNTLMHFLTAAEAYWANPDLTGLQVFGKDVRCLLAVCSQKVSHDPGKSYYHYGPIEVDYGKLDLAVSQDVGDALPGASRNERRRVDLIITDRVYEYRYLRELLRGVFEGRGGRRVKTDDLVVNLALLSLMLDFGLFAAHASLLHLPKLAAVARGDARQLQVEVSNAIHERDKASGHDNVTRLKVEELLFECGTKFLVNKGFDARSRAAELLRSLQGDPAAREYVLLVKLYVSLCQINKSAEVDYYKLKIDNSYRIVIPSTYSTATSDYLDAVMRNHTFVERNGLIRYGELPVFDLSAPQPDVDLYKVRVDPARPGVESYVSYVEISNVFRAFEDASRYLVFVADTALRVDVEAGGKVAVTINRIRLELSSLFLGEALSFVPCFTYADSDDALLFASKHVRYHVDSGGQFHTDYYGMRHDLVDQIFSDELFVDLNDEHAFKAVALGTLVGESKTSVFAPDYVLQVSSRRQLINLLNLAIDLRNVSFFILVLFQLRRCSVALEFRAKEGKIVKISGPWAVAIQYVEGAARNATYDAIFGPRFFDLDASRHLPLPGFVDALCDVFCKFQRRDARGEAEIVPRPAQRAFLRKIIEAPECFHFSEVGSGKTKVILPLFCMAFLSSNEAAHAALRRGGEAKSTLIVLVPEHLVADARAQVMRYCLSLTFRSEYRVYDDIFALLHHDVQLESRAPRRMGYMARPLAPAPRGGPPDKKQIFVTSFNQFKKALTVDAICDKVRPARDRVLVLVDEVDDFLDRDKLVFNICSNKANAFDKPTLERYLETARSVYRGCPVPPEPFDGCGNYQYWAALKEKFAAIHAEVQDASRSINKSFGVFNEETLRHCGTNLAQDLEGYKALIARPYESVNRAMPGSYYSDVERTIYLTYYVMYEDTKKYDELFQQERKFLSFEYFSSRLTEAGVDYDDLVYGHEALSEIVDGNPAAKDGLTRFLYEIVLRKMEVRDQSRSVNSVDVVFNFDCVGFTGTPFIDNYPTRAYVRAGREGPIPDLIDRSFYAHACEGLADDAFEARFRAFQGRASGVRARYADSAFVGGLGELDVLAEVLRREAPAGDAMDVDGPPFNVLVDLCGIFKRATVRQLRDALVGAGTGFEYVYHTDPADGADRVLCLASDNDVHLDEEFYKSLCQAHGADLPSKLFFFVDNRNVIGKDVPFQLHFLARYGRPLFANQVVLAHDVDDFSKIWQAMGRSRTMSATRFGVYLKAAADFPASREAEDVVAWPLTRRLYVRNCDQRAAGNLSSAYQTLVALVNLARDRFYHRDSVVNDFLERLQGTLEKRVRALARTFDEEIFGRALPATILRSVLEGKFRVAADGEVRGTSVDATLARDVLQRVCRAKFELPAEGPDAILSFLSGDARDERAELSYTKQQQKQKQKQRQRAQDQDTMEAWDRRHQIPLQFQADDYYRTANADRPDVKVALNLPIPKPIFELSYVLGGRRLSVRVFPTLQFLYSHHARPEYVDRPVKDYVEGGIRSSGVSAEAFLGACGPPELDPPADPRPQSLADLGITVVTNHIRQNALYSLAALRRGCYVIGTKDQFNAHDLRAAQVYDAVRYVADDQGFVLYDAGAPKGLDEFGPYCVEHYILWEALSKHEVAQNVLEYYVNRKGDLAHALANYREDAGKGFVCWRFIMMDAARAKVKGLPGMGEYDVDHMEPD